MVAAGEADLVATLRWGHEWDIAAATLIAREAGAEISDAFGQPLAFNTRSAEAFGVLVTATGLHPAAVERLSERARAQSRLEEHTSELQSLMRISYAVFCLKKKNKNKEKITSD